MIKKLKENMIKLGFSPKREFAILIGVCLTFLVLGFGLAYLLQNYLIIVFGLGFATVFGVLYVNRYSSKLKNIDKLNLEDFVNIFSYFRIYIHNGFSVYTSLKEIIVFANPSLKELLEKLVKDIDGDKTVRPFVNFAKNFDDIIVEEMMISVYQMIDEGEQSDYLGQFELIFDKFSDLMYQKNLRAKDSKLGTLSSAPLIGSCFLIIILTVGILNVLGELVNGL